MTTAAAQRRYDAISGVLNRYISSEDGGVQHVYSADEAVDIAAVIRELSVLGRSDRWKAAIERWAVMVEKRQADSWSLCQGYIYTNMAVE